MSCQRVYGEVDQHVGLVFDMDLFPLFHAKCFDDARGTNKFQLVCMILMKSKFLTLFIIESPENINSSLQPFHMAITHWKLTQMV